MTRRSTAAVVSEERWNAGRICCFRMRSVPKGSKLTVAGGGETDWIPQEGVGDGQGNVLSSSPFAPLYLHMAD